MPAAAGRRLLGLALPPGPEFVAAAERAWADGDAVLPLDPATPRTLRDALLQALRPHAVIDVTGRTDFGGADFGGGVPVDDDVALVVATSGSTGEPKGAELTWSALDASAQAALRRIDATSDDRWLSCLPWQHIGGLQVWLRARLSGAALEIHPTFDISAVAGSDATAVSLVPTQLLRLLDAGIDVRRFRVVLLGGAAATPTLLERARAAGANVVTTYGMSETCGGCVYDGLPLDGVCVDLGADSRIRLTGPVLMHGYRLRDDLTAQALADGWLLTRDVGSFDDGGRLVVLGRDDDVVVTGGENVVTSAVEHAIASHPSVRDVAVTGVPDDEWGQRVVAIVVTDGKRPTLTELRAWVAERAGAAAAPRDVVVVERIPTLLSGKPDRAAVGRIAQTACGSGNHSAEPPSTT